jgi:hypothetical protein
MAFKQEVNVPLVFTIGVISGIMLLVIVIGTQAWYQSEENIEIAQKTHEAYMADASMFVPGSLVNPMPFPQLKAQQLVALEGKTHWTDDKKKTRATMPVKDAMSWLAEHNGNLP